MEKASVECSGTMVTVARLKIKCTAEAPDAQRHRHETSCSAGGKMNRCCRSALLRNVLDAWSRQPHGM